MAKQIGSYDFKSAKLARDSIEVGGRNYARTNVDSGTSGTSNGVTFTVTGPSAVKVNGTASATAAYGNTWFGGLTLEPGDYMLWLTNTNGGTIWFRLGTGSSNTYVYSTSGNHTRDNPYRFTVTTAATYQFGPVCAAGTFSNVETKFMLEKGTIPTEWSKAEEDVDAAIADGKIWYAECPTAADAVAKVATITPATTAFELKRGVMVNVYFSATNTGAVGSLTLNVNGTGAKPLRNYYNGGVSTLSSAGYLRAGSIITFRYDGTYWLSDLTVDSTYNMAQVSWNQPVIASSDTYVGTHIIVGDSGGYRNLAAGKTFDLGYPILYYATAASTTIASGSTANNHYLSINGVTFTTNGTITSGAANKTLYLKGTISGNVFTVAAAPFMTCTPPTSQDGYIYIPLGVMSSATAGRFTSSKDLYAYVDGAFRQVNPTDIVATQKVYYRSHVGGDVPVPTAWIEKNTDQYNTTVSGGNAGWSTKVTPIASTLNPTEAQKHLYLYTCEQRKRLDGTVKCTGRVSGSNTYALLDDSNTVIDGGKIITGSVTANQIAAGAITAGKIGAGAITADKIAANAITIGMVNGLDTYVTGNLLGNTLNSAWNNVNVSDAGNTYGSVVPYNTAGATRTIESYDTESNAVVLSNDTATGNRGVGWFTKAGAVKAGVKYTFSCLVWASVAVSVHTHTAWRSSAANAYEGWTSAGSKSISANTWTQYSYTFQPDSSAKLTWEFMAAICYTGQSGGVTFKAAHAKLEEGDEATSWYARETAMDAKKTATNYITADTNGIKIANANPASATTYQHQTASSTDFYVSGKKRTSVSGNGLEVFDSDGTTSVANFGSYVDFLDGKVYIGPYGDNGGFAIKNTSGRGSGVIISESLEHTSYVTQLILGEDGISAYYYRGNNMIGVFSSNMDAGTYARGPLSTESVGSSSSKIANGYFTKINGYYPVMTNVASSSNYPGFVFSDGTSSQWIRTTTNGIIPVSADTNGKSSIGTSTWPFANGYFKKINGVTPVLTDTHGSLSNETITVTSSSFNVSANGTASVTMDAPSKSGYEVTGIRSWVTNNNDKLGVVAASVTSFRVRNFTSSAVSSATLTVTYWCAKVS